MRWSIVILVIILFSSCNSDEDDFPYSRYNPVDMNTGTNTDDSQNIDLDVDIPDYHSLDFDKDTIHYLALGDSYTIGTGEKAENRWPNLLSKRMQINGYIFPRPRIIASAGWTTGNLITAIEKQEFDNKYDLVSLLIGVNNQYRGYDFKVFESEFLQLLATGMEMAKSRSGIFVLSIPDYGVTPFGDYAQEQISGEIDEYNEYIQKVCNANEINYYNITEISRKAEGDLSYLVSDQLHPSKKMYEEWIDLLLADPPALFQQ